jgi:hypothetical protein
MSLKFVKVLWYLTMIKQMTNVTKLNYYLLINKKGGMQKMKRSIIVLAIFMAMAMFLPRMADAQANTATQQSWGAILECTPNDGTATNCGSPGTRFICVMSNAAALDQETGLVWEMNPSATKMNYYEAVAHCREIITANRKGWRMPTLDEFTSLIDMGSGPPPMLPREFGVPCYPMDVLGTAYWTSTSRDGIYGAASIVVTVTGDADNYYMKRDMIAATEVMAVRGGGQGYRRY